MATKPQADTGITGNAPLYKSPEPLNPQTHAKLGVKVMDAPFAFAASNHFVPMVGPEFPAAATSFPIIFAGDEKTPLGVLGLNPGDNLFFEKNGTVRPDMYLPAYIRRYPFVVALDDAAQRAVVCIDTGADMVSEDGEMKLFENGELTQYAKDCVDYCQRFEDDRARSEHFVKRMKELDLFTLRKATFTPRNADGTTGEEITISEYFAIDETKVHALSAEVLVQLRDEAHLAWIYAHLVSLWHWDRLIGLHMDRDNKLAAANAA
jgi:hypothetical protein